MLYNRVEKLCLFMFVTNDYNYTRLLDFNCPSEQRNKEKIELARERILLRDSGFSYLPGLTNVVLAPLSIYDDLKSAYTAVKIGDREGTAHTSARVFQNFLAFCGSAGSVIEYQDAIFHNLPPLLPKQVGYASGILGVILCFVEFIIESIALIRTSIFKDSSLMRFAKFLEKNQNLVTENPQQFSKELKKELLNIVEHLTDIEKEKFDHLIQGIGDSSFQPLIQMCAKELNQLSVATLTRAFSAKYFDKHDGMKQVTLERRIGVWSCKDLEPKLAKLSAELSEGVPNEVAMNETRKLFQFLDDQALKKQIVHLLGIGAAVLVGVAIALTFCSGYGAAVVIALFAIGTLLSFIRYGYLHGVCNHEGWDFHFKACLPDIKSYLPEFLHVVVDDIHSAWNRFKARLSKIKPYLSEALHKKSEDIQEIWSRFKGHLPNLKSHLPECPEGLQKKIDRQREAHLSVA
jgi:hypothetical protein